MLQAERSPATFDLRAQVAGDRCGAGRSLVCMSASLLRFSSRNQLVRSVGLTVHPSAEVSRNSALTKI